MAVESRFVVIRHGVEVQTFMDKKAADDYDKMLDMADNLTAMLDATPFELSDEVKEDLSIYLAQNREDVLVALQAKKAKPAAKKVVSSPVSSTKVVPIEEASNQKNLITEQPVIKKDTNIEETTKEKTIAKKVVKKTKTASGIANSPSKKTTSSSQ